jgi:hypothetical protein
MPVGIISQVLKNNMEKKQHNNYLVFLNILIVVYSLYISLSVFKEKAVVTDDLAGVYALRMIPIPISAIFILFWILR